MFDLITELHRHTLFVVVGGGVVDGGGGVVVVVVVVSVTICSHFVAKGTLNFPAVMG